MRVGGKSEWEWVHGPRRHQRAAGLADGCGAS